MEKKINEIKTKHSFDDINIGTQTSSGKLFGLNLSFFDEEDGSTKINKEEEEKMLESEIRDLHDVNQKELLKKLQES